MSTKENDILFEILEERALAVGIDYQEYTDPLKLENDIIDAEVKQKERSDSDFDDEQTLTHMQ